VSTLPIESPWDCVLAEDSIAGLAGLASDSIHAIVSDIPYGIAAADWDVLHSNTNSALRGSSPAQARAGGVFQSRGKPINGWSSADRLMAAEYHAWCAEWAAEWYRVLKPGASAVLFAGRRFSHRTVLALEEAGFNLKDQLAWVKPTAPLRAQRLSVVFDRRGDDTAAAEWDGWRLGNLRPTFEPILWCVKPYPIGTTIADNVKRYGVGAFNPAALAGLTTDSGNVLYSGMATGEGGLHPTQKPLALMRGLVGLVTGPGDVVLDPFAGSGTTLVAAKLLSRKYLGYEIDSEHVATARERLARIEETLWPIQ
jgi:site-specific DNA-methyltransferase (adenine-specific)